jgi:hypothetical protein
MGLEVLVRPLVVPSSKPTAKAPLPPDDDGGAGRAIDEVTTALLVKPSGKTPVVRTLAKPAAADNIEILSTDNIRSNPDA